MALLLQEGNKPRGSAGPQKDKGPRTGEQKMKGALVVKIAVFAGSCINTRRESQDRDVDQSVHTTRPLAVGQET